MGFGKWARNFIIAGLTIPLAFCSSGEPRPTQTPVPTNTRPAPTATVRATPYPSPTYTPVPPTATPTPVPPTATPVQYLLSARAFHDYNGNGTQDGGEPPLAGITNSTGRLSCTTGDDGRCELGRVPAGRYRMVIQDPSGRYTHVYPYPIVIPISDGLQVVVNGDTQVSVPLVEGPYRPPVCVEPFSYFDLDPMLGLVRDYRGNRTPVNWGGGTPGVEDQHAGYDYNIPEGTPIHAVAYGIVLEVGEQEFNPGFPGEKYVWIGHPTLGTMSQYHHLSRIDVTPGQEVLPGYIIALGSANL